MSGKDLSVIVDYALEKSVELTRSSIGYVSLYDKGKKRIKMLSWSSNAMDRCHMTNIPLEFDLDSTGVWGGNPSVRGMPSSSMITRRAG